MISALTGTLRQVVEDRVYVEAGPMVYEMLIPASDVELLQGSVGEQMTFHTIFYLEGDASSGSLDPRLIGFLRREDKRFFEKFITVKGIGPKKALRALAMPVGQIAHAIESKDARFLSQLPMVGKRLAEQIVAELAGKVQEFAADLPADARRGAGLSQTIRRFSEVEEDAIAALMALGERRLDAEHLLERARQASGHLNTTDAYVREMLRLRTVRV
ncbi:Holliday junction branch migration protein RuvA [Fontivita pretiosa]|jgi:Holliday junction DNA helicase RuvA|uniref:Holliday junction branch migration protein RuvA n=1 Tax=Fontivita pretiosa TaxID=2989684 RepID=UPI003D164DA1